VRRLDSFSRRAERTASRIQTVSAESGRALSSYSVWAYLGLIKWAGVLAVR